MVIDEIHAIVARLRERQATAPTRQCALAITKLEEAAMWLEHASSADTPKEKTE